MTSDINVNITQAGDELQVTIYLLLLLHIQINIFLGKHRLSNGIICDNIYAVESAFAAWSVTAASQDRMRNCIPTERERKVALNGRLK